LGDFLTAILDGYVEGAKREVQQATIADMQATQQREDQLRAVIQELSTPIIPIYRGVLVLPLVGAIDSMRSQEITERLLEEIVRQQADIVIIDITGVSVVDTSVANHLIMTAQAVNLLGSRVIFTGISSTIAQTIIQLGVNLGDVVTLSNLQAGMQFALEQLGLEIAELNAA
jgi:rsbT co-antagonist protein RsbR